MTASEIYEQHALRERESAAETNLPNVKALHERSASHWANLADQARRCELGRASKW